MDEWLGEWMIGFRFLKGKASTYPKLADVRYTVKHRGNAGAKHPEEAGFSSTLSPSGPQQFLPI